MVVSMFELTPKERVKKARIKLLREKPFFGYALMHVHLVSKNDPKPRGPKIVYNEKFVENLDDDELQAVLCHELLHYLLGHTKRAKAARRKLRAEKDRQYYRRMNIAEDCVVNAILLKNGFKLPRTKVVIDGSEVKVRQGGIIPGIDYSSGRLVVRLQDAGEKKYEIWDPDQKSAEEIYWEIRDFTVGGGSGDEEDNDTMYFSDDETYEEENDDDRDRKGGDGDENGDRNRDECKDKDENDGGKSVSGSGSGGSKEDCMGKTPDELLSEAYTYAKMQGNAPAGFDRLVTEVLKPKVNWKALLRRYLAQMVPYDYSYLKPSKSSPPDIILPGVVKAEHLEALVAVDTSGSISDEELAQFLSEIRWVARNYPSIDLTLVSCDAEVQTEEQIRSRHGLERFRPKGGGGTDFRPVFNLAMKRRARLIIFFTDGFGAFPERKPPFPTIWIVSAQGAPESHFPFGKVIKM